MMWGGELLRRDGAAAGQVTSAAWGATVGGAVGLAWLRREDGDPVTPDWVGAGEHTVAVGSRVVPVRVSLRPPYDPTSERTRG
jgi:4-methylaminobutanoate oxidase (formaldehyde-forming)